MNWQKAGLSSFDLNDDVHVWKFESSKTSTAIDFFSILSNEEKDRALKFHFEKDRISYLTAHYNLRRLISNYLKIDPQDVNFVTNKYGKPFIDGINKLQFNISHSGNIVLIAFHKSKPVGVDVEMHRDDIKYAEIAERFFSKNEVQALKTALQSNQKELFFRVWSRKEAYIKGIGKGLSIPLGSFDVSLTKEAKILKAETKASDKNQWNIKSLNPKKGYSAAVTCALPDFSLKCWQDI